MTPVSFRLSRKVGTSDVLAAGTDIVLQVGPDPGSAEAGERHRIKVKIQRIKLEHISGGAANFTPSMFSAASGVLTEIEQEYLGSVTAVAVLFDATDIQGYCYTDTRGRLYLRPTPDAGADNVFDYAVYYEILF
jgi:hypothetical protein